MLDQPRQAVSVSMKVGTIIQARMNSKRLRGKSLYRVAGKAMLQYLIETLTHCNESKTLVVATSIETADDPIMTFCRNFDIFCVRGSETDVAGRFMNVLEEFNWDAFVRVNGDSPLLDHRLIDKGINLFRENGPDLITNVYPRTFPKGQSVEVIRVSTFRSAYQRMASDEEREHVTTHFYRNASLYRISNFESGQQYSNIQLSVDTAGDITIFERMVSKMVKAHWEYTMEETIDLYKQVMGTGPTSGVHVT